MNLSESLLAEPLLAESLLVEITRGTMTESTHNCDAVVMDARGAIIAKWGDVDREIYSRSSVKPLQALPLLETGAADHFHYSHAEVAFACASHNGEDIHTTTASRILDRLGLGESDLECGAHRPYLESKTDQMIHQGQQPCRLHNNCSGKHAGFLATAVHMGEAPAGYIDYDHPVQSRITRGMSEMMDHDLTRGARGIDGCGIPVLGMSLTALARGMARMADPSGLGTVRENAARRIVQAMAAHPHMVAGTGRLDTVAMQAMDGKVVLKGGAEGVHIAILPERGLGIALKARCGEKRASEATILWLLQHLGFIGTSAAEALKDWINPPVTNTLGNKVGSIRVCAVGA